MWSTTDVFFPLHAPILPKVWCGMCKAHWDSFERAQESCKMEAGLHRNNPLPDYTVWVETGFFLYVWGRICPCFLWGQPRHEEKYCEAATSWKSPDLPFLLLAFHPQHLANCLWSCKEYLNTLKKEKESNAVGTVWLWVRAGYSIC